LTHPDDAPLVDPFSGKPQRGDFLIFLVFPSLRFSVERVVGRSNDRVSKPFAKPGHPSREIFLYLGYVAAVFVAGVLVGLVA
jgi:hypothetical protein